MQQIKIFSGREDATGELERMVNEWLATSNARVLQMFGNIAPQTVMRDAGGGRIVGAETAGQPRFAPSDLMLVVLYETA